ncbi:hypothetical protein [Conexibacter woesei]|uniref:Uncharacterized protein n=1 Tax=Conexibacter woesei (strain DSM 14684 / CCUG 47730 / CIP 108061 / JCM 11494 / NBRC 100937 / ID131577) TaxID=469383 RepID=D3F5K8_CONWI|nr:hypothetical protein [Conexibacter woesei]ADB50675.1 hypothetical protein Cwoe_2250 [Conexibacter woesei DSM 14684]
MPRKLTIDRAEAKPLALALLLAAMAVTGVASLTAVLMLSPALLLFALLLAGRTPGEELILRWRARARRPRDRRAATMPVRRYVARFVRGTDRMSASALAMRPPPAPAVGIG